MKPMLTLMLAMVALTFTLAAQQPPDRMPAAPLPPEAYPGQREHAQPPEGFNCMRQTTKLDVPPEKACTCERMYSPTDPTVVLEDEHCTVFCHAYACACGIGGGHAAGDRPPILPDPR